MVVNDMHVLLLLLPFASCGWRQLVVAAGAVVLQVVESQVSQLSRLDAKIGECLCILVDDLVQAFHLKLLWAAYWPVNHLVKDIENRRKKSFWYVEMAAPVDDFLVDKGSDFSHAIVGWAVQLESLSGRCVIVANLLKGGTNIDSLGKESAGMT